MRHAKPLLVGLNCALGAEEMRPYLAEMARVADSFVSCYPNAGLPNAFGEYDESPDETAAIVAEFAEAGLPQPRSAAAAARRPTTSPRWRERSRAWPRACSSPLDAGAAAVRASSR